MTKKLHLGRIGIYCLSVHVMGAYTPEDGPISLIVAPERTNATWATLISDGVTHSAITDLVHGNIDRIASYFLPDIKNEHLAWRFETRAHYNNNVPPACVILTIGHVNTLREGAFFKKSSAHITHS
jgi:hypothetical protein